MKALLLVLHVVNIYQATLVRGSVRGVRKGWPRQYTHGDNGNKLRQSIIWYCPRIRSVSSLLHVEDIVVLHIGDYSQ